MNQKDIFLTLKRVAFIAGLLVAAIVVISAVERKNVSNATGVEVQISPLGKEVFLIDQADVLTTIERSFGYELAGQPIATLDVARLERVLEKDPFVYDADVFIDATNVVHIEIEQREPVLRIIDNNGLNYYLDDAGNKMPLSKHFSARLLVATGNIPPHTPDFLERKKHLMKDLFYLARMIRQDPFLTALIEQIHVQNGRYILTPKLGRQMIILGEFEGAQDKFERLRIFYEEAIARMGWQKYKTIDLSYKDQVVCEKY